MISIKGLKRQLKESAWLLGICENGFDDLKKNRIHWISNGKYDGKKWFADPFILDYDEKKIRLLVEEFDYKLHRGRIAKLIVNREKWVVDECKIILDLPTHLSFPMIWREKGNVFVCPENYKSGGWNLYRYHDEGEPLEFVAQLSKEKLTDATLYHDGLYYWLFSTYEPHPNGNELTIWKSTTITGSYNETQRVKFDENIGRNAGVIFLCQGKLIRPAQESNLSYGHSIVFQEVVMDNDKFFFKEKYRFHSPHKKYNVGTHTFNTLGNLAVIDVKGYRDPILGKMISSMGEVLVKFHLKRQYRPV